MCFSAPVSFVASGSLVLLGGASLVAAKKEEKILAAVPLLFGIQQAFEGFQWLYLNNSSSSLIAGYGFLFFALIVWPVYVPTFVFILNKEKRKILKWFVILGIVLVTYYLWVFLTKTLAINEVKNCINYSFGSPNINGFANICYMLVIFGPLFLSSKKIFKWFGILVAISVIISWYFFTKNMISVWCFFAAIISSFLFVYIKYRKQILGHYKK